jgi:uncharacterized membrane-anchored protein YhcB (DUF1043 family)
MIKSGWANVKPEDEKLISRYLLGELTDEEKDFFEERLFTDSSLFEETEAARDELIENYLRGDLAGQTREKFERYFLASPGRRDTVETLSTLLKVASERVLPDAPVIAPFRKDRSNRQAGRWLLAAAALVIAVAVGWLITTSLRLKNHLEQMESERQALQQREQELQQQLSEEQAGREQLLEELRREQAERARLEQELTRVDSNQQSLIASLNLYPGLVRGAGKTTALIIGASTRLARLRVNFEGKRYPSYRAVLQTVEGKTLWQRDALKAAGNSITVDIPASLLKESDYLVTLSGAPPQGHQEEIGKYFFRVVRK